MKNEYKVEYITIKDQLWAEEKEIYLKVESMNELIEKMNKAVSTDWRILRIWERLPDGCFALCLSKKI